MRSPKIVTEHTMTLSITTWDTKDKNLYIRRMCPTSTALANVSVYHPDMRLRTQDLCQTTESLLHSFVQRDRYILATGIVSRESAFMQLIDGNWVLTQALKQRTAEGQLLTQCSHTPLELLYAGWANRLCQVKQQLCLGDGTVLTAKDMTILHQYLLNMPRKEIAAKAFVTVKAIEKRLTRLREMLAHQDRPDDSLHSSLYTRDLIPFLIAQTNWFELTPTHTVHH